MLPEEVEILVVEDVNSIRIQIRDILKSFGFFKVVLTSNGEEAKAYLRQKQFHLIISDWKMEPTDGLALLKFVRLNHRHKKTAFIMLTAEGTRERVVEAISQGCDDYVLKPLTLSQVQDKIFSVLFKRKIF